jgi:hypothetical protein
MYFGTKSYLKSIHNHTAKHALNGLFTKRKHVLYSPTYHQSKAETKILVLLISFKIKRYGCFTKPQFQLKCDLNYSKIIFISFDLNKKIKPLKWG